MRRLALLLMSVPVLFCAGCGAGLAAAALLGATAMLVEEADETSAGYWYTDYTSTGYDYTGYDYGYDFLGPYGGYYGQIWQRVRVVLGIVNEDGEPIGNAAVKIDDRLDSMRSLPVWTTLETISPGGDHPSSLAYRPINWYSKELFVLLDDVYDRVMLPVQVSKLGYEPVSVRVTVKKGPDNQVAWYDADVVLPLRTVTGGSPTVISGADSPPDPGPTSPLPLSEDHQVVARRGES